MQNKTEIKSSYMYIMHVYNGALNEIELGDLLGLEEDYTMRIISQLLAENKIEHQLNKHCNYSIIKPKTKRL